MWNLSYVACNRDSTCSTNTMQYSNVCFLSSKTVSKILGCVEIPVSWLASLYIVYLIKTMIDISEYFGHVTLPSSADWPRYRHVT